MGIPETISKNTFLVYQQNEKFQKLTKLNSDDFSWDKNIPKPLQELCVEIIAINWIENPLLEELRFNKNIRLLLDLLPTDLPYNLSVSKINDDSYWKRCYFTRWPNKLPLKKPKTDTSIDYEKQSGHSTISRNSSLASIKTSINSLCEQKQDVVVVSPINADQISIKSDVLISKGTTEIDWPLRHVDKTWKCCFLELHLEEVLENLKPEEYEPEKMKNLSDLCGLFVRTLHLKQMTASSNSSKIADHIPLNSILSGLPLLTELSLCFKQTYVGEEFSWHVLQTTLNDIKQLGSGLERCNLQMFRIYNSDIDCEKIIILLKSLLKNKYLKILDLSHCKVGNRGTIAISRFLQELPSLKSLILSNNYIEHQGVEYLSYALVKSELNTLDLRLNEINDKGGNYIASALVKGCNSLENLQLAGCKLNENNIPIIKMFENNSNLKYIDLSNNKFNEELGLHILQALDINKTINKIDMRICNISPQTTLKIKEKIELNQDLKNKIKDIVKMNDCNNEFYKFDELKLQRKLNDIFMDTVTDEEEIISENVEQSHDLLDD